MVDPAFTNARRKRPRLVKAGNSASGADDLIKKGIMGDGPNSLLASGDALSPFLQPRYEVGDLTVSGSGIHTVCTQFGLGLYWVCTCSYVIYNGFTHGLHKVYLHSRAHLFQVCA
jgi:hypothetical protein